MENMISLDDISFGREIHRFLEFAEDASRNENPHSALTWMMGYLSDCGKHGEKNGKILHDILEENLQFGDNKDEGYWRHELPNLVRGVNRFLHEEELETLPDEIEED